MTDIQTPVTGKAVDVLQAINEFIKENDIPPHHQRAVPKDWYQEQQ